MEKTKTNQTDRVTEIALILGDPETRMRHNKSGQIIWIRPRDMTQGGTWARVSDGSLRWWSFVDLAENWHLVL